MSRPVAGRPGPPTTADRARAALVVVGAVMAPALIALACATDRGDEPTTLRVFAAASLADVMADLGAGFEAERAADGPGSGSEPASAPGVSIELNLAGSPSLRAQIREGAPADVVATANPEIMDQLAADGELIGPARRFASNRLVIAVAPGNPAAIDSLADLADPDLFIGLCAPGVPCGDLADRALAAAGLEVPADTREPDVRSLLAKIEAGELDAGMVYATDLAAARGVEGIELGADLPTTTSYPAAVLARSDHPDLGRAFIDFLTGPAGQNILAAHGFGAP